MCKDLAYYCEWLKVADVVIKAGTTQVKILTCTAETLRCSCR
jgi:hypothetical protein